MGRESSNPIVIQSSIALSQARFRQLRRMKEMREERELFMRKLQKSNQYEAMMVTEDYDPMAAGFFFHFLPPRSPPAHVSLWSDSDSQSKQSSMYGMNTPVLMSLLPIKMPNSEVSSIKPEGCSDSDDVDTSLHL
ncbi:hypothetical protein SLE2022_322570 [Rubroshorea leprosula]